MAASPTHADETNTNALKEANGDDETGEQFIVRSNDLYEMVGGAGGGSGVRRLGRTATDRSHDSAHSFRKLLGSAHRRATRRH